MLAQVASAAILGVEAYLVRVEVDVSHGLPSFQTVGLPTEAVREGRDRVISALRNSGFGLPPSRVTVNLAPADLRKAGAAFDLPIALGLLLAEGELPPECVRRKLFLGELGLDGRLRPVTGVLPMVLAARRGGLQEVVVPAANAAEAALVDSLPVWGLESLSEVVDCLLGRMPARAGAPSGGRGVGAAEAERGAGAADEKGRATGPPAPDLTDVRGQESAKRALEVAAAGGHNLLFVGPPGAGKTMLARCLPSILPPLTREDAIEVTCIHSAAGKMPRGAGLIERAPFRAPHHTVSYAGLVGGGPLPRPGEVSLAHRGVLFLDELPEFKRSVLEALRQPLEEGRINLVRAGGSAEFPARFALVAAMNPCPCGGAGSAAGGSAAGAFGGTTGRGACRCTPAQIERYLARVSGPLLDRMDIQVAMPPVRFSELSDSAGGGHSGSGNCASLPGSSSREVAERVAAARARQRARFAGRDGGPPLNARMSASEIAEFCVLDREGRSLLERAMERLGLSARAYHRILRVARTIADLEGGDAIVPAHVAEAIQYRSLDRMRK